MKTPITLTKSDASTSSWSPLEAGVVSVADRGAVRLLISDAARRPYVDAPVRAGQPLRFLARGAAGRHDVALLGADGARRAGTGFDVRARTAVSCGEGPYAKLALLLQNLMRTYGERRALTVDGKCYNFLISWGRDHTHVLKAMKYFVDDVKSGIEFFLERQQPNGMFWDDCHSSNTRPHPNWFCEALGEGYWGYSQDMAYTFRRIPIEADVEFLYTECVHHAWKATGDDAWMAAQLPKLEKALVYNGSHPTRWSRRHGLVKRSFCMDSWDFANPHYCQGDHRCINPGDAQFLFHGDNSGFYSSHIRMAEMCEALGNRRRAAQLRAAGERLRRRANAKLFFATNYGHMIPETLPPREVYALVGDERKRMSLSTGYTINRGLPTHEMAVKILREYRRRGRALRSGSFAEWWSMDPMYDARQWPGKQSEPGHYMNGSIGVVVAGELAKAAFEHGMEDYGVDILRRVWRLAERDGGRLGASYRRLPENPAPPRATFGTVDLRAFANVGLRHGAARGVPAWTDEGDNDMRNLPVGRRAFGAIEFDVIDPARNGGRAVVRLDATGRKGPAAIDIPVAFRKGRSVYFMHALPSNAGQVAGLYTVSYVDGSSERIYLRPGQEIGNWWGLTDQPDLRRSRETVNRQTTRVAWQGANGTWKSVGLYMFGWNNPRPDTPISTIRCEALPGRGGAGGLLLAAVSVSDSPVKFDTDIHSGGWPDNWSHAAVYHAIAEGLAGIEDRGRAMDHVRVAPRWAATESRDNRVTLHYPASGGYCSYTYRLERKRRRIELDLTGSFARADVHCLLPGRARARRVQVDGRDVAFVQTRLEGSRYVDFAMDGLPRGPIVIEY